MKHSRRATRQQEAALQLVLQAFKRVKRLPGIKPPPASEAGPLCRRLRQRATR